MSNIRATYSGLILFLVTIISIIAGVIFSIIITRILSPEEFGEWRIIIGIVSYVVVIHSVVSYWTTREIARGVESAKTAIISSGIFSALGIGIYIAISFIVSKPIGIEYNVLVLATTIIPLMIIQKILIAISLGTKKPHVGSYGQLVFEIARIPSAIFFVYFIEMSVIGVILAVIISYFPSIIFLLILNRKQIKYEFQRKFIKKWLKLSWLPLYPSIAKQLFLLDIILVPILINSVTAVAFFGASWIIANVTSFTATISKPTYSKLLGEKDGNNVSTNIQLTLYFAIPVTFAGIIFAKPSLFLLNPEYQIAVFVVVFLVLRAVLMNMSNVLRQYLKGVENIDTNENTEIKSFVKSKLFFLPTLQTIQYGSYLIILLIVLFFIQKSTDELQQVVYWAMIAFIFEIPFFIILFKLAKEFVTIKIDKLRIVKYITTSMFVFGISYMISDSIIVYNENLLKFIISFGIMMIGSFGLYFTITYFIDKKTKLLFHAIINEVIKKK